MATTDIVITLAPNPDNADTAPVAPAPKFTEDSLGRLRDQLERFGTIVSIVAGT